MTDLARGVSDAETPVNPYSLLEAVNRSSDTAHTGWLIFLGIMAYLMIAVAGVTHQDLLLERPVQLPVLQVEIQLTQFFQFAPLILVLMHLGLISQLVLLARETIELDRAIRLLETSARRSHPLRLELNNFFFVQAIAGPHRSRVMSTFLHAMSWLTLVIIPVVLLLYVQVVFLPYHDVGITWTQRALLVADIAILISIGVFLARTETSFLQAFIKTSANHPFTFLATALLLAAVAFFSFFVATVPGEALDRITGGSDRSRSTQAGAGFKLPFLSSSVDGSLFGIFRRNLVVTDTDLVSDKEHQPGEPSLNLRGRDLRYASLDRSDLHFADFTGANLRGASLAGADLRGALLQCADVNQLLLSDDRVGARCTVARNADFSRARLGGANLTGLDARGAVLRDAALEEAEVSYARLSGAEFFGANLEKAELAGAEAHAASFLTANLQGADLNGAMLHFADFTSATLQGAVLSHAHLHGAVLRDADLEAATLSYARLEGADMTGASIAAADLRGARVWMTEPPAADASGLADLSALAIAPVDEAEAARLTAMLGRIDPLAVRAKVKDALGPILTPETSQAWTGAPGKSAWEARQAGTAPAPADGYKAQLTGYLTSFACKSRWSSGAVATGLARRAQGTQFQGDAVAVYDRLKADDCPGSKAMAPAVQRALATAADKARGN